MAPQPHPRSRKDERDNHSYDGDVDGGGGIGNCLATLLEWPVMIAAGIIVPIFAITFIIVGAVFIDDCKIEPMIPIWLIVQGVIMLFGIGTGGFARKTSPRCTNVSLPIKLLGLVISLITIAWFIAGNVWVYQAWGEGVDYQHYWYINGCDMSVYRLSFWGVIVLDVLFGVAAAVTVVAFILRGCRCR